MTQTQPLAFVIDDDPQLGMLFAQVLTLSGFRARHIIDSTQALALISEQKPDVILLDMQMPKLNGVQVLHAIRADDEIAHITVIVASASHLMIDEQVRDMANLVLQKPVSLDQIRDFAQRMLTAQSNADSSASH